MRSVTLKSAMTPSFIGLMATMLPGVRPSISLASLPTASTSPVFLLMATIEGSLTTMPLPRAYTSVLAVPRSMARSLENIQNNERRLCERDEPLLNPLFDIALLLSSGNSSRPWNLGLRPVPFASLSPPSSILRFFYSTSIFRRTGCHLGTGRSEHFSEHCPENILPNRILDIKTLLNHHFPAVHHDARSRFRLARHFDHVSVLDQRINVERQIYFFLRLDNDRKAILFAFHRFLAGPVVRLDGPIVSADRQTSHNHARGFHLAVEQ